MADAQLRRQRDEVIARNRARRESEMKEAAAQAAERNRRHGR